LSVSDTLTEAALASSLIPAVLPLLKLKLTPASVAALPTSVPADLPIPDLSDAATAGSIMSYGLSSSKACSETCGMAGQFAPSGLLGRVGSLFS